MAPLSGRRSDWQLIESRCWDWWVGTRLVWSPRSQTIKKASGASEDSLNSVLTSGVKTALWESSANRRYSTGRFTLSEGWWVVKISRERQFRNQHLLDARGPTSETRDQASCAG
jgi:hypothetical protein